VSTCCGSVAQCDLLHSIVSVFVLFYIRKIFLREYQYTCVKCLKLLRSIIFEVASLQMLLAAVLT